MRKAFDKVVDTVMRRETLGYDKLGNKYFRYVVPRYRISRTNVR